TREGPGAAAASIEVASKPIRLFRKTTGKLRRELVRFVFADPVLRHQPREEAAIDPPRGVMARRNRPEGTRVAVEADRIVEPGSLRRLLAKAQHALGAVVKPPGRPELEDRVMTGERRQLARVRRLVQREQDQ